ncbi:hypothetical protein [Thermoflexus sp.]|uniref:hypothetical protein n=1 Tax=Thermoflexus sp. TaxID=1969742 RepID=UPI002ADD9714|nr:hypothetical protein [Thermoflexus sp.]
MPDEFGAAAELRELSLAEGDLPPIPISVLGLVACLTGERRRWIPVVTYGLELAIGLAYGWRRGWDALTDRLDRMLWVVALLSGGSAAGPPGAHLGMRASHSRGPMDLLLIPVTTGG